MKKFKINKWVLVSVIALVVFFGSMTFASATRNQPGWEPATEELSNQLKAKYGVAGRDDSANNKFIITANKGFTFNVNIGYFRDGTLIKSDNKTFTDRLEYGYTEEDFEIIFLVVPTDLPENIRGHITLRLETTAPVGPVMIANVNYDGVCADFRNSKEFTGASAAGQDYFRNNLSYCFNRQVTFNYEESAIRSLINTHVRLWDLQNANLGGITQPSPDAKPIGLNSGDGTARNVGTLQCDAFSGTDNIRKFYTTQNTNVMDGSTKVCEVSCVEELTVIYSPPTAVKAGLCIEYEVTIRSKVSCQSKITIEPPKRQPVCTPRPICNRLGEFWETQAGPDEDFDKCIEETDSGKYTQNAINKCYKQVYGTTPQAARKMENMITYNDSPAIRMSNCGVLGTGADSGASYGDIMNAYNARQTAADGYFSRSGQTITWNKGACHWQGLGRFYFSTPSWAERTVRELRNGDAYGFRYFIDNGGFKRATSCGETCVWTGCTNGEFLNEKDAAADYSKKLADYTNAVAKCSSFNVCRETDATFRFEVDLDTISQGSRTINFGPATDGPGGNDNKDGIVIDQGGICYGKSQCVNNPNVPQQPSDCQYGTTITFPGTWWDKKTGAVTFVKPGDDQFWGYEPNKFCTPPDAKEVNVPWGQWSILNGKVSSPSCNVLNNYAGCTQEEKDTISNLSYNIRAFITNFGRYNWNVNVNCFYSIWNGTATPPTTPSTPVTSESICTGGAECDTDITNYNFRVIDLENMFPDSTSQGGNREQGFNWSADGTNINNSSYEIIPTALITSIQEVGNSIYSDEYLDYHIKLTKEELRTIRREYRKQGFSTFGYEYLGNKPRIVSENGVTSYTSPLISALGGSVIKRGTPGVNNQRTDLAKYHDDIIAAKKELAQANK